MRTVLTILFIIVLVKLAAMITTKWCPICCRHRWVWQFPMILWSGDGLKRAAFCGRHVSGLMTNRE